jgi:hypothetical protein
MDDYDAKLGIYSDRNNLTDRLENRFKEKYLDVQVFSNPQKIDFSKLSYLIINLLDKHSNLDEIKRLVNGLECKVLVIFPLCVKPEEKFVADSGLKELIEINRNIGVILVPEILGSSVKYDKDSVSHDLIMQSIVSERVKISNQSNLINFITPNKLSDVVVKEMFSFGISGKILSLIGPRRGQRSFCVNCLGIKDENILTVNKNIDLAEVNHTFSIKIEFSLNKAVKETKESFLSGLENTEEIFSVKKTPIAETTKDVLPVSKTKKKSKFFKAILNSFLAILLFLSLPLILMSVSAALFFFSVKTSLSNSTSAERLISLSLKTVLLSQKASLGLPFYFDYSNILYKTEFLFNETLELSKISKDFGVQILGKEGYSLGVYSDSLSAILDRIHTDIGFLQSDINELGGVAGQKVKRFLIDKKIDIGEYKNKVYLVRNFSSRLGVLLGMEKKMTYLILFQNNMELRPTGGFIGSFATVSFDKGRMSEMVVNDVYTADGQLKGHVDPPLPIHDVLGEGGWYLRDANWDPNYPDSAEKIEWFLDKEMNIQVDGVVAIDLTFIQKILKVIGPISLPDYNKTITADNLYQSTQEEVESNFFPGSTKKASFMTALSKQLLTELQQTKSNNYFAILNQVYSSLEERHIQLYLHDANAQEAFNKLGYAGIFDMTGDCGIRCLVDKYSIVDANLGVNKANLYIKRDQNLNLKVSKNSVEHELFVTYQNTANGAIGNAGVYKNYARLLVPKEAQVTGVRIYNAGGGFEDVPFDRQNLLNRQEVGFLVNVLPGDSKRVQIVWKINNNSLSNGGEYQLVVQKQAGTVNDKLEINVQETDLSLTGKAPSVYTTTLGRDFSLKLFFKQ